MRACVIGGNWKMHGDRAFVGAFVAALGRESLPGAVVTLLFPPAAYLQTLRHELGESAIACGVQNVHWEPAGAFTGELSAEMAVDLGAGWMLAGHSERRLLFGETDQDVARKIGAGRRAGLSVLVCVGETLAEREAGSAEAVVARQLNDGVRAGADSLAGIAIAYEPVWAIGTGQTASPEQAQAMHAAIRRQLGVLYGDEAAADTAILYGGSMKPDNAAALLAQADIDGGLIGGASLNAADFAAIVRAGD